MAKHSCLYFGRLRHRRLLPQPHAFEYGLFMVYLDLGELDTVFRGQWLWSVNRGNVACFRRGDYLGDPQKPLDQAVRDWVEARAGERPAGPIRMLTHLRYFGYCFNPVTFYYCYDSAGLAVETIVAEITNTPWGERHGYLLDRRLEHGRKAVHRYQFRKCFHVSPFLPMDIDYDWRFSDPGSRLMVHMNLARENQKMFDATLSLQRREITPRNLAAALLRFPWMTFGVIFGIHWQAALLKLKGIPFYKHPASVE